MTEEERNALFNEQSKALTSSAESYDRGEKWEAKRLATAAYILCHDAPFKMSKSKSLLGQMGIKDRLNFLSTRYELSSPYSKTPLITIAIGKEPAHFKPHLESHREHWRWLRFNAWWNETVYEAWNGRKLSRKNLVFALRSQDGGAHADEYIRDVDYHQFRSLIDPRLQRNRPEEGVRNAFRFEDAGEVKALPGPMGVISGSPTSGKRPDERSIWEPIPDAHLATMRQIAFELSSSIGRLIRPDRA